MAAKGRKPLLKKGKHFFIVEIFNRNLPDDVYFSNFMYIFLGNFTITCPNLADEKTETTTYT